MIKYILSIVLSVIFALCNAQERKYTDKERGGAENGCFGKVADALEVTPMGQLSYEIPIPTLPGTAGMKPTLSVSYSSSTKDGLLGYGTDLAGLSVISRAPSDIMHDGSCRAISFTDYDHFTLDGQRLMRFYHSTSSETEYRTENNIFSRIVLHGKDTSPSGFTVQTKSGLRYEYVPVSVALGDASSDSTLFWVVTKVCDTAGNYYSVTYSGDAATNDFYPSRIDYTGNESAGLAPYASIRFEYMENAYSPTKFVSGVRVRKSRVLTSVVLFFGETEVRRLLFGYTHDNRKFLLARVTEKSPDGSMKNPTLLSWATLAGLNVKEADYLQTKLIHKATLTTGDFDGDGRTDFIATPQDKNAGWKGWRMFLSRGKSLENVCSGLWQSDNDIEQVVSGDFNGDGRSDIVIKRHSSGKYRNCDLYLSTVDDHGNVRLKFSECFLTVSGEVTIQAADLNGDGATDIFAWLPGTKECRLVRSVSAYGGLEPLADVATAYCSEKWDRVELGDFDGDGLTDILNLTDKGNTIVRFSSSGSWTGERHSTWPDKHHNMELGDFNGDGKTDMLLTGWDKDPNKDGWSSWCVNYSTGDGGFARVYRGRPFNAKDRRMFIADFNGDGFDDFLAIDRKSDGLYMTQPQAFINDGDGNFRMQPLGDAVYAADKWRFYLGDVNGDGKSDLLCTSDWDKSNWDGYQLYLMPDGMANLLTGIVDGLGNTTSIEYRNLTDSGVFSRGDTSEYPLVSAGLSWPVVSAVATPDGIGGTSRTTYRYADALFHKTGRGLLGFRERTVTDEDTKTVTTTEYDAVKERYIMVPVHSRTTVNGRTVAENQTECRLSAGYQNNPVRREVFTCLPSSTTGRKYEYTTGNLTEEVTATHEYDKYGNETQVTVNDGIVQTTVSNTYTNGEESWILGRLTRSTVTKTNAHGVIEKESSFEYDKTTGLLLSETFLPEDKELGYRKTYCRDKFGNITTSVMSANDDSDMRITATGYDGRGRFVTSTINSLGFRETAEYDGATGNVVSSTDINGIVTALEYGTFDELHETATPTSRSLKTTGWSEGMAGAPQRALYFEWNKTTGAPYSLTFYDSLGRELRTVTQSVGGKEVFSDREYDKRGNVIKSSEPYFSGDAVYWNTYEYDDAGRLTGQTSPDGSTVSISYDGRKTVTVDPTGSRTVKVMNMAGQLESVEDDSGTATRYAYDAEGKVVGIVGPRKTVSCAYDNAGNRTILYDPDTGQTEDTYNGFGELMTHKDSHGTTTYEYDSAGRMTRETRPDMTVTTEYDKTWKGSVSRVSSVGNTRYAKTYTYDSYGRVTEESVTAGDRTFTVGTTYNGMGLVDITTYPSGMCVRNRYDGCGTLTAVSDAEGNVTYWRLNTLDARGQAEKETLGNGLTTVTGHDSRNGRLSAMQTPGVQDWEYAYDAVGNITLRRDLRRGMAESFTYDNLHRLTGVAKNGVAAMAVSYDAAGNITKKTDIGNYVYEDGSNKLVTIKDCCRTLVDWDEVAYSSFDKVTMVRSGDRTMTIGYGADKSRVYSELQGVRRYYVGDLFELETGTDGKTKSRCYVYAFGKAVAQIVRETGKADAVVYMHHDHLGSIQAYTDESGRLLYELSYDAWGMKRNPNTWITSVLPTSERTCGDRGFTEHEHIEVFEMINMDGRMYDPMTGRFLSADPVVQAPESSQGLNRYAYCMNNPLSLVDPTGYSWFSKNWKALTASFVGIAVSVVTAGTGTGLSAALLAGAAGGAASALTGALLNGANIGQVAKTTFTGAFWGAASAAMNNSIGTIQNVWQKIGMHSISQGALEGLQGGDIIHGLVSGATSSLGGKLINDNLSSIGKVGEVAANSILSGTIDEIGGGKFANGAVTGAFNILFNDLMHDEKQIEIKSHRLSEIDKPLEAVYPEFDVLFLFRNTLNLTNVNVLGNLLDYIKMTRIKICYTSHGLQQAKLRGFSDKHIKKILIHGRKKISTGKFGKPTIKYVYKGNTVVVNDKGKIITTFSDSNNPNHPRGYIKPFN